MEPSHLNGAKISALWAGFMPRRGLRDAARGFNPGNRPINGSALKGRKLTWINPTHIAPQNEFRVCLRFYDQFGEGELAGDSTKNMDMIFHTADLKRVALQAPQGSGQIGMHPIGVRRTARMAFDFWWRK